MYTHRHTQTHIEKLLSAFPSREYECNISLEICFQRPSGPAEWQRGARAAQRGNNGSDFPKGSDTGAEINCTIRKMNKGICAVIKGV